jgi:hypothetical protein
MLIASDITGGGHVKFLHPAGVDVGTYASRKRVSGLLDHSVSCRVFFTTKTVLGCRDTGLQISILNANFTVLQSKNRRSFPSKTRGFLEMNVLTTSYCKRFCIAVLRAV